MAVNAPVALFLYNRPSHARRTLEALARNELASDTDLHIFCDGAASDAAQPDVSEVRAIAHAASGFATVRVIERERNLGLAASIIAGVTEVCGQYGRIIVLEDDLVTSASFLRYMNDALRCYQSDERVGSIHGYWYPAAAPMPETFFLRGASCWGWATWSRAWNLLEKDGSVLLARLEQQQLTGAFDLDGAMAYTKMLQDQIAGRNKSWAIRWHASMFLANKLQLSPGRSLVRNVGFDGTGVHCDTTDAFDVELASGPVQVGTVPVEGSGSARAALIRYYRSTQRSLPARILGRLRRMIAA
jgi:Glycosyl transferase family 2